MKRIITIIAAVIVLLLLGTLLVPESYDKSKVNPQILAATKGITHIRPNTYMDGGSAGIELYSGPVPGPHAPYEPEKIPDNIFFIPNYDSFKTLQITPTLIDPIKSPKIILTRHDRHYLIDLVEKMPSHPYDMPLEVQDSLSSTHKYKIIFFWNQLWE